MWSTSGSASTGGSPTSCWPAPIKQPCRAAPTSAWVQTSFCSVQSTLAIATRSESYERSSAHMNEGYHGSLSAPAAALHIVAGNAAGAQVGAALSGPCRTLKASPSWSHVGARRLQWPHPARRTVATASMRRMQGQCWRQRQREARMGGGQHRSPQYNSMGNIPAPIRSPKPCRKLTGRKEPAAGSVCGGGISRGWCGRGGRQVLAGQSPVACTETHCHIATPLT